MLFLGKRLFLFYFYFYGLFGKQLKLNIYFKLWNLLEEALKQLIRLYLKCFSPMLDIMIGMSELWRSTIKYSFWKITMGRWDSNEIIATKISRVRYQPIKKHTLTIHRQFGLNMKVNIKDATNARELFTIQSVAITSISLSENGIRTWLV